MSATAFEQNSLPGDVEPERTWEIQVRRAGGDAPLLTRQMTQSFAVIGRRSDCDIRLPGASVAPRHIYLQRLGGSLLVIDLGSPDFGRRTGVLGRPGRAFVDVLHPGTAVRVGDYQVSAVFSSPGSEPAVNGERAQDPPLPQFFEPVACWELTNLKGDETVIRRHIRHAVTLIGSGPLCRIRIAHPSASSVHASLVWKNRTLFVIDLCSRTGVCVNGQPVRGAPLNEGDELSIGHCRGVIHLLPWSSEAAPIPETAAVRGSEGAPAPMIPSELCPPEPMIGPVAEVLAAPTIDVPGELLPRDEHVPARVEHVDAAAIKPQYSEEFVLSLVAQLMAMQERVLEQTQRLMSDVTDRVNASNAAAALPPDSESAVQGSPHGIDAAVSVESENRAPDADKIVRSQTADADADVHAWLNQRLAGLESTPPGRLAQLWDRLTGSG